MSLIQQLQKFDLTENEAKVYLACLELGPESVQNISQRAKLNRVTVYGLIEGLMKKGFLHEELVKNKRKVAAYSPVKLYDVVTGREERVRRQTQMLNTLVPQLKDLTGKQTTKTNIIYYEGHEGLKNWASDVLGTKGELLEWTKIEEFDKRFEEYLTVFYFPTKCRRQISTRFIFMDTPDAREYIKKRYLSVKNAPPMKARFVPKEKFKMPGFMTIYNDRLSVALPKEMRAITVIDQLMADMQREIFEFCWLNAKDEIKNKPYPLDR